MFHKMLNVEINGFKQCDDLNFFCCEDHFDLKEDMENYMYYTTMGSRAKIKVDVVPHKFSCQPNRKRQGNTTLRPASEKRQKQQIIQEILSESSKNIEINNPQELNIETISVNSVHHIEVDSAPLNITPAEKVSVETQTEIKNRTVAVHVHIRKIIKEPLNKKICLDKTIECGSIEQQLQEQEAEKILMDIKKEIDESNMVENIDIHDDFAIEQKYQGYLHIKNENITDTEDTAKNKESQHQEDFVVKKEYLQDINIPCPEIEFVDVNEHPTKESIEFNLKDESYRSDTVINKYSLQTFNCDQCEHSTDKKSNLTSHQLKHTDKRPFKYGQ